MSVKTQFREMQHCHFLHWKGAVADDLLLLSLTGKESISAPFHYQLRSLTELDEKEIAALHGKSVSCQIGTEGNQWPRRHVHGVITQINCHRDRDNQRLCTLTLEPAFALLRLGRSMRIWQNISVPDIVSSLLSEHHITAVDIQLRSMYSKREYCMQYRESDFDFICRLLEEEGIYYFFTHSEAQHQLVLADHPSGHPTSSSTLCWHHHGKILTAGNIDRWSSCSSLIPDAVMLTGYNAQQAARISHKLTSRSEYPRAHHVTRTDITPQGERDQVIGMTKKIIEAYETNTRFFEAQVNAHWLSCGEVFEFTEHPTDNGRFRIHELTIDATNNFEQKTSHCNSTIHALHDSVVWRPICTHQSREIAGVLTARVVGPTSEEIHTDEYGRIKIQFPWDNENQHNHTSSCWVRVSQPWTGNRFGGQFLPRIGSEVLVSFIQGNPDFPLVIGTVYNGENNPPFPLPGEKNESGFVSRSSSKGGMEEGHRLSFNDTKGEEKLTMTAQKDLQLTVKNDWTSLVSRKVICKIGADRDTEIVEGNETLILKKGHLQQQVYGNYALTTTGCSINTKKACVIESNQSITLKVGSSQIALTPVGITLSGNIIKIDGAAITELKGAMAQIMGKGMVRIQGGIINIG
ncbi:type VI secretion system tip protein VgrG [Serratia sp. JSRIV001]|uniref:type VI secretion system Vgr family protein n=1 Tax=unclassified Serratia (in: enterobacteria) TaxID=2647522 RepID=UPI001CBDDC02|nr:MULTISPECIES: type VI secretion system tip protein TssI/VgrG [unclassified Serratia (in: enterobacteria)]UAN45163.1 type VI secretion system tip protein VgrG [Serratia sp. JSRIV001]UAN50670.1 type VI secretion system tip protein VgrG [Serratia sp. JSRIV002]UAN56627.1 type VI secretion system tip protein VgrG [Serratia sp. JSRIV004]UAN62234.1 type VI secretion system tip protein VgrG [Serratia sp. JSRIV006]